MFTPETDSFSPQVSRGKGRETFQTDQYQATCKTTTHHRNALKFLGKLFSSSYILHRPHPARLHSNMAFCCFCFVSLCAYSTSKQDCKPSLQYSTLQHPCAYRHAHSAYDTDLYSRTQPLLCLANEGNHRCFCRVGATFLYRALPRIM